MVIEIGTIGIILLIIIMWWWLKSDETIEGTIDMSDTHLKKMFEARYLGKKHTVIPYWGIYEDNHYVVKGDSSTYDTGYFQITYMSLKSTDMFRQKEPFIILWIRDFGDYDFNDDTFTSVGDLPVDMPDSLKDQIGTDLAIGSGVAPKSRIYVSREGGRQINKGGVGEEANNFITTENKNNINVHFIRFLEPIDKFIHIAIWRKRGPIHMKVYFR